MVATVRKFRRTPVVQTWVNHAAKTGQPDAYNGKRRWTRITWDATLAVSVLSGRHNGEILYVRAKDVSLGGLSFVSRKPLATHTPVEIAADCNPDSTTAVVRHCTPTIGGYIIGVEFDDQPSLRRAG